jgi:hypothetical protein
VIFSASRNDLLAIRENIKKMFVVGARMLDATALCSANRIKRFISEKTQDVEQAIKTNNDAFEKSRLEIVEKYCAKNEDGSPKTTENVEQKTISTEIDPLKRKQFDEEYKVLAEKYSEISATVQKELDEVVSIEFVPINISLFKGEMLPHEAEGLEPFIEIK